MQERRRRDRSWNAESIRRLRDHVGLTQAELAAELNTRQQTISEWERGAYRPRGPSARLLTRVAEDAAFPYEASRAAEGRDTAVDEERGRGSHGGANTGGGNDSS